MGTYFTLHNNKKSLSFRKMDFTLGYMNMCEIANGLYDKEIHKFYGRTIK